MLASDLHFNIKRGLALFIALLANFTFTICGQTNSDAPSVPKANVSAVPSSAFNVAHFNLSDLRAGVNVNDPKALRQYYDELFVVASLQGLVNRAGPKLIIRYEPDLDDFWWSILKQPGGWMEHANNQDIGSLDQLLTTFRSAYQGVVVYDESVPATSLVAASVAGADGLLVVRYDPDPGSFYTKLTTGPHALPVKVRLIQQDGSPLFTGQGIIPGTELPSTKSAKNDAYRWLIEKYLKTGKLDSTEVGYMRDAYWLRGAGDSDGGLIVNLDYFISKKNLMFDLDCAQNETPIDDPHQPVGTDFETLCLIFKTCNNLNHNQRIIQLHGFVPFGIKYSTMSGGKLEPVGSEWRFVQVISAFNVIGEVDGNSFPNSSFTRHYQLPGKVSQNVPPPSKERLIAEGILKKDGSLPEVTFYAHYAGDYDSGAWIYRFMPAIWNDPARGDLPISWGINPNLDSMVEPYMYWMRQTAKGQDDFVAGDSGAGYINPHQLSEPREFSGLPSGVALWESFAGPAMKKWDLDVIGFVIDGNTPFMKNDALSAYSRVAPGGIGTQIPPPEPVFRRMPMVTIPIYLNPIDANATVAIAAGPVKQALATCSDHFLIIRSVLWKPAEFVELEKQLDQLGTVPRKLVSMRTLLWLRRYKTDLESVKAH